MSSRFLHRVKFTGEVEPAQEPQALNTHISLLNLMRMAEKLELAKVLGDETLRKIGDVVEPALTQYFEGLSEEERRVIEFNAHAAVDFLVQVEEIRAKQRMTPTDDT